MIQLLLSWNIPPYSPVSNTLSWQHADWGGIVPSIARRDHLAYIDKVVNKAMSNAKCLMSNIDAIAVTVGPGLAIALEVGIAKAKELAKKYNKPLIAVNHIEGHLLSPLATSLNPSPKLRRGKPKAGRGVPRSSRVWRTHRTNFGGRNWQI